MASVILKQTAPLARVYLSGVPGMILPVTAVRRRSNFRPAPPKDYSWVVFPERRRLPPFERKPDNDEVQRAIFGEGRRREPSRKKDFRGPEPFHTSLNHKQFGIRALQAGALKWGHFEMMRNTLNRKLDESRMFALYRVPGPNKPITQKAENSRMGGGKGAIRYYVTPIKEGRIILEVGGHIEFDEVFGIMNIVARNLPFKAEVVTHEMLLEEEKEIKKLEAENKNPFDFRFMLKHNINGCRRFAGRYDWMWNGKYR